MLGLKPKQIYKWFWDTKKKVEENPEFATYLTTTDAEFDQLSNTINKQKDFIRVEGRNGSGKKLTPQEIKQAIRINQGAC